MSENYIQHWRVTAAALLATVLIVGSYVIARNVNSPSVAQASAETELLQRVASRDTDGDGLPDWQEALYGTDPRSTDTRNLGMTDSEAVSKGLIVPVAIGRSLTATSTQGGIAGVDSSLPIPAKGTITRALSESFITTYAKAVQKSPDGTLSPADIKNISDEVIKQLDQAFAPAPDFRSLSGLKVAGSGSEAMKEYVESIEVVFLSYKAYATTSEIAYLKSALENGDQTAYPHIASIAKAYRDTAVGLAAIPVPSELADSHLALVNSMARLGNVIEDFTRADSDPIATMLALKQYTGSVESLGTAIVNIITQLKQANVSFAPGTPGSRFVGIIDRVITRQQKEGSPLAP